MRPRRSDTNPVDTLVFQCKAVGLPEPDREFRFARPRMWRADLVFGLGHLSSPLIVEIQGGVFVAGRHARGVGIEKDYEKAAAALMMGYRVLNVTPRHIQQGKAVLWIEALLK